MQPPIEEYTHLTGGAKPVLTYQTEHAFDLPEYPKSNPYGLTYIIPTRGQTFDEIKKSLSTVINTKPIDNQLITDL
jgi:hypothetical protein